jgi:hypothetical protein
MPGFYNVYGPFSGRKRRRFDRSGSVFIFVSNTSNFNLSRLNKNIESETDTN